MRLQSPISPPARPCHTADLRSRGSTAHATSASVDAEVTGALHVLPRVTEIWYRDRYTACMPSWTRHHPSTAAVVCLLGLLALLGCGENVFRPATGAGASPIAIPASIWVGAWGASMTNAEPSAENAGGKDESFRFLITPTLGGTQERVKFSNVYGSAPVTLGAARLSLGADGSRAIDPTHDAALRFNGQSSVTVPAGATVTSDPVAITFHLGQVLAVSVFLKGSFTPVSRHNSYFIDNFRSGTGSGDRTADAAGAAFTATTRDWLLVNEVDVFGPFQGTVVLFGSSTTDGFKSDFSSDRIYPTPNVPIPGQHAARLADWLARRLDAAGYKLGVINAGVPGDTVTNDITNTLNHVGNANQRFAQDVLTIPNVTALVTYFGSIDIRSPDCKSAPAIEAATEHLLATAATAGLRTLIGTIPPSAFCTDPSASNFGPTPTPSDPFAGGGISGPENGGETQRKSLNAWIRATGASLPGVVGVVDFDVALKDPARPDFLLPPFNSGDNFHPTGAGYAAEAAAIPLPLLLPPASH